MPLVFLDFCRRQSCCTTQNIFVRDSSIVHLLAARWKVCSDESENTAKFQLPRSCFQESYSSTVQYFVEKQVPVFQSILAPKKKWTYIQTDKRLSRLRYNQTFHQLPRLLHTRQVEHMISCFADGDSFQAICFSSLLHICVYPPIASDPSLRVGCKVIVYVPGGLSL